jgi:hypothetical protein
MVPLNGKSVATTGDDGGGFLSRLTPRLVDELVLNLRSAWYPAGTLLPATPALVFSGRLRYFSSAPDGGEVTQREAVPGDLVGTVNRHRRGRSSRIEVLRPSVLLHLDQRRVTALAARWPELSEALFAA